MALLASKPNHNQEETAIREEARESELKVPARPPFRIETISALAWRCPNYLFCIWHEGEMQGGWTNYHDRPTSLWEVRNFRSWHSFIDHKPGPSTSCSGRWFFVSAHSIGGIERRIREGPQAATSNMCRSIWTQWAVFAAIHCNGFRNGYQTGALEDWLPVVSPQAQSVPLHRLSLSQPLPTADAHL